MKDTIKRAALWTAETAGYAIGATFGYLGLPIFTTPIVHKGATCAVIALNGPAKGLIAKFSQKLIVDFICAEAVGLTAIAGFVGGGAIGTGVVKGGIYTVQLAAHEYKKHRYLAGVAESIKVNQPIEISFNVLGKEENFVVRLEKSKDKILTFSMNM